MWRDYLDEVRRDDSSYWAAALVLAMKSGNISNELSARENLKRLGFDVVRVPIICDRCEGDGKAQSVVILFEEYEIKIKESNHE